MGITQVRQFIAEQIEETPEWVRDTVFGLFAGAACLLVWMAASPLLLPQASADSAAVAVSPPDSFAAMQARDVVEAQAAPTGAPLLWVVKNKGATVYLFGSVHVLRSNLNWMDPRLFHAFDSSQEAWFEMPDLTARPHGGMATSNPMAAQPVLANGLNGGEKAELANFLSPYGYSLKSAAHIEPWAMAQTLDQTSLRAMGFNFNRGADMTLFQRAHDLHIKVGGFESADQQARFITAMTHTVKTSGTQQLKTALAAYAGRAPLGDDISAMANEWRFGDEKGLNAMVASERQHWGESGYKLMLADRNRAWIPQLEALLHGDKTVFVTVGVAHLVGPDGVIALLRHDGWDVQRLDL